MRKSKEPTEIYDKDNKLEDNPSRIANILNDYLIKKISDTVNTKEEAIRRVSNQV